MDLGHLTGYSWQHLGAVERGDVAPSEDVVAACDRALCAGGQLVAVFPAVVREQASNRHKRGATRRNAAVETDAAVDWGRLSAAARRPSSVSAPLLDELEQITNQQRALYHRLSSAEMLPPVEAHLSLLASLLRGSQPEPVRHRLASAAAEAAGFAAWLWLDLGDHFKMGSLYTMADGLLREAANPALRSYITAYQALAAEASGLGDQALGHATTARSQAPPSTSRLTRSWLDAVTASTVAHTGDRRGTLRLLGQASDHLAAAQGGEEWMYEFDHSALAAYQGQCHLRLGHADDAVTAYEAGLAEVPPTCQKRKAFLAVGLAEAFLVARKVDAATHYAHLALGTFATAGSGSGLSRVQRFHNLLAGAGHQREASDLDQRIRHLATTA